MEAAYMSVDRLMDKEVLVYIYNEWIWASCSKADEPRTCQTEWSRSEREKCHKLKHIYEMYKSGIDEPLLGRNRVTHIESETMDTVGERKDGTNWDSIIDIYHVWNS